MSADARPLEWVGEQPARSGAGRPELRPVPDRDDAAALRGPGRLLFVQQQLNGAATVPELLGRASDLARGECGFDRAIILTVEAGALRADRLRALEDPASDRLRRQLLAEPLELRPGSAEAEFIRLVESGRGEFSGGPSLLRGRYGFGELALAAIMPEDAVLALLVLDRARPKVDPADRVVAQGFAQLISHALERQLMRQRINDLASELKYMMASSSALLHESLHAPMQLDRATAGATTFGQIGSIKPQTTEQLRELFTRREWTVAKEIIAGKSNREIASSLQLSPETVKTYVSRVLRKLGAANRAEAVARYFSLTTAAAR
jgi:LuxR family transcriptional regulator, regulator of acetate metabolism